jgi:hypothetical protein
MCCRVCLKPDSRGRLTPTWDRSPALRVDSMPPSLLGWIRLELHLLATGLRLVTLSAMKRKTEISTKLAKGSWMTLGLRSGSVWPAAATRMLLAFGLSMALCLGLIGCKSSSTPIAIAEPAVENNDDGGTEQADDSGTPSAKQEQAKLTIDAMVGQVNGRALYASEMLDPIKKVLESLGAKGLSSNRVQIEARTLINRRIEEHIFNALLVAEARRDLEDGALAGLEFMARQRRAELVRLHGNGSPTIADIEMGGNGDGRAMDYELKRFRERVVIRNYMQNKVWIDINVRRRDIERYYFNHEEQFNRPANWHVRFIKISSLSDADRIQGLLASGKSFLEVSKDKANEFGAGELKIPDGKLFDPTLTEKVSQLKADEHTERVAIKDQEQQTAYWWVFVQKIDDSESKSLSETQQMIWRLLTGQRRTRLQAELRVKLLKQITLEEKNRMLLALLEVAVNRYLQAP